VDSFNKKKNNKKTDQQKKNLKEQIWNGVLNVKM
jgi:hypothetical protein